jgi:hypothetical protein
MNDFKVGDRVEYVGATTTRMIGKIGVVVEPPFANSGMVYFDHGGAEPYGAYSQNLRHLPAPDVITIVRTDLPEVRVDGLHLIADKNAFGRFLDADGHRKMALSQLAVAEFLEREGASEKEAAEKLNKRRDELAKEVAKKADWVGWRGALFINHQSEAQAAIDMMIIAEANRG